jgi:hypothetical protein
VVDATNVQPEARRPLIALARLHGRVPVAILVSRGGCITSALRSHSAVEVVGAVLGAVSRGAGRGVGAVAAG